MLKNASDMADGLWKMAETFVFSISLQPFAIRSAFFSGLLSTSEPVTGCQLPTETDIVALDDRRMGCAAFSPDMVRR